MPNTIKGFIAEEEIKPRRFVSIGSADKQVVQADGTKPILGASANEKAVPASGVVDVNLGPLGEVEYGGAIVRCGMLVSAAGGLATLASVSSGVNSYVGGSALSSGVSEEIHEIQISPSVMQGE